MNPMAQPDLHPDADALNAFVEHALSGAERARIVAHVAGCERCRDIVFLAQSAAGPEFTSAPAPRPDQSPSQGGTWFSHAFAKWRVALIPAAALASVGAIVLWFQLRPAPARLETAKLAPQTATATPALEQETPPTAPASPDLYAGSVPQSVAPSKSNQAGQTPRRQPKPPIPPAVGLTEMNQSLVAPDSVAAPGQTRAASPIHLDGHSASLARYAPPEPVSPPSVTTFSAARTAVAPQREEAANKLANAEATTQAQVAPPPAVPPAPPSSTSVEVQGDLLSSPIGWPSPVAAQSQPGTELAPQPTEFALMGLSRRAKLPSGLNSVSSAALLSRLVAVDSAGSVFFSQDGGKRWETVPAQWGGKALVVKAPPLTLQKLETATEVNRPPVSAEAPLASSAAQVAIPAPTTPPSPTGANGAAANKPLPPAKAAPRAPELLFRLVTDRHEVWVSADGKAWRRQ